MHTKGRAIFHFYRLEEHYTFTDTHNQLATVNKTRITNSVLSPKRGEERPREPKPIQNNNNSKVSKLATTKLATTRNWHQFSAQNLLDPSHLNPCRRTDQSSFRPAISVQLLGMKDLPGNDLKENDRKGEESRGLLKENGKKENDGWDQKDDSSTGNEAHNPHHNS